MVDATDTGILRSLDENARKSDSAIAKEIAVSKQVVNYRIAALEREGIITGYYTILNIGKLGLDSYYVYLQFTGLTKESEEVLLSWIASRSYVAWLVTGVGRWDAVVLVCAESIATFEIILGEMTRHAKDHILERMHSTLVTAEHISYPFLRSTKTNPVSVTQQAPSHILDAVDWQILKTLDQDARLPVTELAARTGIPLHTAHYRLKRLVKESVIDGFRPRISVGKLGYQWHLLLVEFQSVDRKRLELFTEFCKTIAAVYYVTRVVGPYDLMLDIHVRSPQEFRETLFLMKERFPDVIKHYESMTVFEERVIRYVLDGPTAYLKKK